MVQPTAVLALLPLENLSDQKEDEILARGFIQDLISEVSRFPMLGVISAQSVFSEDAGNPESPEIVHRLGVDYFMRGSVRRWEKDLRISVQLVNAKTGQHIWAGRYDSENLPAVQDEIAARIANALAVRVDQAILSSARRRSVKSLKAYECWLRGLDCLQRGTEDSDREGRAFFERAIDIDPDFARAHGGLSLSHFNEWSCQAWEHWEEKEQLAYDHAVRAERLDPDDAMVQVILGRIEQYRRQFDRAEPRFARAFQLAPNDAQILGSLAMSQTFQGNAKLGNEFGKRALELNPLCPGWFYCLLCLPLFALEHYEEALQLGALAPPGSVVDLPAYKAAAYAFLGNTEHAGRCLEEFRHDFRQRISKCSEAGDEELLRWLIHVNPYRRQEDTERFIKGLMLAGLEGHPAEGKKDSRVSWPIANVFRREGDLWIMAFEHDVAQMAELRGFLDIARLLGMPGVEVAAADLAEIPVQSVGVEKLDDRARSAYRARLGELEAEIEDATAAASRVRRLEDERETLVQELRGAVGLGGRARKSGDSIERARTAVTWRIRHAIRKLESVHPALARHLENSIRTGVFCSYQPERAVRWNV
jgi:TolB-like protein